MQTDPFFEDLEDELAQFTDEQVDSMRSATETDLRYRAEIWVLYPFALAVPASVMLIGMYMLNLQGVSGVMRFVYLAVVIASAFGAVHLFTMVSAKYARWRYTSSFLRQLASAKAASGL